MLFMMEYKSPIGNLILAAEDQALIGLWMEGQKYFPDLSKEKIERTEEYPILTQTKRWLDRYFKGERPSAEELKLNPRGSSFRQEIWRLLCQIPYGEVTTYGALARLAADSLGRHSMSAQAAGGAVGHNPISIIIPCHRVLGADGSLTGYAGGISKKIWLLGHEGIPEYGKLRNRKG